jgi:hypothetical protein
MTQRFASILLLILILLGASISIDSATATESIGTGKSLPCGKSYLFDYGDFQIRVTYKSNSTLQWEQIKGPMQGTSAEEKLHAVTIRPNVYFISWQEKDLSIVNQVADFERQKVYTAWISPDRKLIHLEGTIQESK